MKWTLEMGSKIVKVIPQYCIAHPYCAQFLHISARKLARARAQRKKFPSS